MSLSQAWSSGQGIKTNMWFRLQAFLPANPQEGFLEEASRAYA